MGIPVEIKANLIVIDLIMLINQAAFVKLFSAAARASAPGARFIRRKLVGPLFYRRKL
jgi:hypothetical protein